MRIPFSKDQIVERMKFENPWWQNGQVEDYYSGMKKREYFNLFYPLVTERSIKRAVVLMGPRRVGKTVMIFHAIQTLINSGVPARNICYLSIETPIYNGIALEELLHHFWEIGDNKTDGNTYIFFDEIQYLKDWEVHLKSLVDSYHKIKFVVSGSAAAALKLKSNESGAGRFTDFILPPLTFHEYLALKNIKNLIVETEPGTASPITGSLRDYHVKDIKKLNEHFVNYINFGGYPEVTLSETIQADPGRYIRNDIVDKVLMRDLPLLYGIEDIQELNSLFTYIAYKTGSEMSLDTISQSSGVSKNTIKKYITYLEAAFLIKVIQRIDDSAKKFKRANFFKIYLTNPSLRCALFSPIASDDNFMGSLVETAVFSQWQHSETQLYYSRWDKGEVDIVHLNRMQQPEWAVEVKWTNRQANPENYNELKNIKNFCIQHGLKNTIVTTLDKNEKAEIDLLQFNFIPSALYCYIIGRNALQHKINKLPADTDDTGTMQVNEAPVKYAAASFGLVPRPVVLD